ncbi:hypothetical protein B0J18DRAFT_238938 [Chaetomium sp. MPI-SDFR-AT-0129]|nr:hypothetical protein B0J18DRAFT_238938 [Chaetomium sp. MPI-SDFR-AT-0129]
MGNGNKVPDAWDDDDWEVQADRAAKEVPAAPAAREPPAPLSRAERLAKHAEEQRKLWESAETRSEPALFLPPPANAVPLTTPFKPAVKLLSRKPAPQVVTRRDPITGLEQLTVRDDDDDEDDADKKKQETPEEIRKRQQRELEEKQRRYEEARAKIFGESKPKSNTSSGQSSPRTGTPPLGGGGGEGRQNYRGRGRGRGGRAGGRDRDRDRDQENTRQDRRQPNAQQPGGTRELFDPGYSPKPGGFNSQKRGDASPQLGSRTPREEDQIIRAPRGPDGSGRGGFGFARRGDSKG